MLSSSGHYGLFEAIRYKRLRQAMLLAEAGIDVDCRNEKGQTPLIYAVLAVDDCDRSRTKLVRLFLEAGADPNVPDYRGMTALMHAASRGLVDAVKSLLEYAWTSPSLTDPSGNTALMFAASHGHDDVVAAFVAAFRNDVRALQLHRRNNDGLTALQLAVRNRHEACARILTREAQCFPAQPHSFQFPDPRELDREPTPAEGRPRHQRKGSHRRTTGTMTIEEEDDQDLTRESSLSVLECSVGDLPARNYTHPFGLQTSKSTQVVTVAKDAKENEAAAAEEAKSAAQHKETKDSPRIDEWPAIPLQLKPTPSRLVGPLVPIEVPATHPPPFQRKCLLKEQAKAASGLRVKAHNAGRHHLKHHSTFVIDQDIISGASVKALHVQRSRQPSALNKKESVVSLLPLIPCGKDMDSLPPVRYSFKRSGSSSKKSAGYPSASYVSVRADQTPRELESFRKNLAVLS